VSPQAPLVIVAGPTGSGKSDLALSLAETFHGEIVNCDSLQLYRYLNLGTAKTPESERRGVPHHLFDILNPDEVFTAGGYARIARKVIREISDSGKLPIVVGGTGFYLRALLDGLFQGPERNMDLRTRLARRPESLHNLLNRFDPSAAARIHQNDIQKLIRALEVCLQTRQPITSLHARGREALEGFRPVKLGLDPPRHELVDRLNVRCTSMFESGLVEEIRQVIVRGYPQSSKAFESIGYREAILHLNGHITLEQAITDTQTATRQYAKRQRTWFRREPGIVSLPSFGNLPQTLETAIGHIQNHLNIF
jgi:tRNA dimethylallyltransferase